MRFSIDEWESLPWWQQRVYVDGLIREEKLNWTEVPQNWKDAKMAQDRVALRPSETALDDYSSLGFTASTVELDEGAE